MKNWTEQELMIIVYLCHKVFPTSDDNMNKIIDHVLGKAQQGLKVLEMTKVFNKPQDRQEDTTTNEKEDGFPLSATNA